MTTFVFIFKKFQSTRPRGARRTPRHVRRPHPHCFNPRARVGRDAHSLLSVCAYCSFNPRARVGRDILPARSGISSACFNPRARVGRDPKAR